MVFDLGTTQSFPFVQVVLGGFFLWLGINLQIIYVEPEDTTEE